MIFAAIEAHQSEQLLKESKSHWLLRETEKFGELSLDYLSQDGKLASIPILVTQTKNYWKEVEENATQDDPILLDDELDTKEKIVNEELTEHIAKESDDTNDAPITNKESDIDADLPVANNQDDTEKIMTNEELTDQITTKLAQLYDAKQLNYPLKSCIRLLPIKTEQTESVIYASYCKNKKSKQLTAALIIDINNWIHTTVLKNCLLDMRLYPTQSLYCNEKSSRLFVAQNSKDIATIQAGLARLLKGGSANLPSSLVNHPYYKTIKKTFWHRVNKILEEISSNQVNKVNKELIAQYNSEQKQVTKEYNIQPEKKCKQIDIETIKLADNQTAYIASCQGERLNQEDRAFVINGIKLDPSWQDRIPEMLVYIIQQLANEIYEKYSAESGKLAIGTTLSLVFRWDNKLYKAWLGDSPIIGVKTNFTTKEIKADYLYWSHRLKQNPVEEKEITEASEIITKQQEAHIEKENGVITISETTVRLNGFLMMTHAIGDRCPGLGNAVTDIPSVAVEDLAEDEEITLILGSDGLMDCVSLQQLVKIFQTTRIENLARACCETAYLNVPVDPKIKADNSIAAVLAKCLNGTLIAALDGHAQKNGHLFAEYAKQHLPQIFKRIAENKAPLPIIVPDLATTSETKPFSSNFTNTTSSSSNSGFTFINDMNQNHKPKPNIRKSQVLDADANDSINTEKMEDTENEKHTQSTSATKKHKFDPNTNNNNSNPSTRLKTHTLQ